MTATAIPRESLPSAGQPRNGNDAGGGFRIGQGYDVHALVPGRPLVIGGVHIDYPRGLLGHSDADVLLHAITDAILGAAGLGDIGQLFPDTDPALSGADSAILLREAMRLAAGRGYRLGNVDATIIAQEPKLARHLPAMIANIAQALSCEAGQVNLKAKTNERLGYLGRAEGIEAQAVVLLAGPAVRGRAGRWRRAREDGLTVVQGRPVRSADTGRKTGVGQHVVPQAVVANGLQAPSLAALSQRPVRKHFAGEPLVEQHGTRFHTAFATATTHPTSSPDVGSGGGGCRGRGLFVVEPSADEGKVGHSCP